MSAQESIRLVDRGDIGFIEFDMVGEKVNKLSSPIMARFKEVIEEVSRSQFKAVILISRKPNIFIAGADIEEIKTMKGRENIFKIVSNGQKILNQLEDLKIPTIVAIHGACMGGGCEIALACDYRIASDVPATRIGLPEIKLGIMPGFGGCVRLPKVIGVQNALDIILAGKAVNATKAEKIGLIDKKVHPGILEEKAIEMAREIIERGGAKRKKRYKAKNLTNKLLESYLGNKLVFFQALKMTKSFTRGHYPAPLKALEVIKKTLCKNRDEALIIEANAFAELAETDVSKNLIHVFFLSESVKKQSGIANREIKPRAVKSMAVLGAGTMGGGIAYVAASGAIDVRLKDISSDALAKGFQAASKLWSKELEKKRIDRYQMGRNLARLSSTFDFSGFGQLDVVIEAIVEDMNIKKKVILETAKHCNPNCIFATNTSSLSVSEMGEAHPHPENFIGMHFFNPVDKMPLVEVIRGAKTSDEVVATVFDLCKKLGKIPVVVKDGPGFLVNRLLMPWLSEALFFLSDGMDIVKVDRIYTHKFGMPMGPFHLIDEIGLDVCLKVLKIFNKAIGDRAELPKVFESLAKTGRLGKKGGKGFYIYQGREKNVDPTIYTELGLDAPKASHDEKEIIERGIFRMLNEAAIVLKDEKIVETAGELDLAMIMGTGFPPFRGGLAKYADSLGPQYVTDELEMMSSKFGQRFKPSQAMVNMAKSGRGFY
ncbi:MAG: 3-hydroxyacyl-CoA dehydrogenase NAD-binding domain-containing protein [Pseudomonadota bacterium]|nr:3-hydroxyacyl-CoA dehydrogenase NAD-binding domain-containing protein [Pseudomonadota bacterium]